MVGGGGGAACWRVAEDVRNHLSIITLSIDNWTFGHLDVWTFGRLDDDMKMSATKTKNLVVDNFESDMKING